MKQTGQNVGGVGAVANTSLPFDPLSMFLLDDNNIRVQPEAALPQSSDRNVKDTEATYALMMHFSDSLGVNCTYCHNTRNFQGWEESRPQRVTAWHGIRMARDLNNDYMEPLTQTFPENRLGPKGDVAKVNCTTCHQGAFKPLYGAAMAKDYPELQALAKP
jgi:photosynthetic reaction center cytochrome c subunit